MNCKFDVIRIKRNEFAHYETIRRIPFDLLNPRYVINQKAYFLGLKKDSIAPIPKCVVVYDVDACKFNIIKVPVHLAFSEAKIVEAYFGQ